MFQQTYAIFRKEEKETASFSVLMALSHIAFIEIVVISIFKL